MDLALHGSTRDPLINSILVARMINGYLGGAFVVPGDVPDLDPELVDAVDGLVSGLSQIRAGLAKRDQILKNWRSKHPTYGKWK